MHIHRRSPRMLLPSPPALAIGNFDGVHLGHQAVIKALRKAAAEQGLTPMLMSFFPHPREVVTGTPPSLITTLRDRTYWLSQYGIAHWALLSFTQRLRCCAPRDFVRDYLVRDLGIKHLIVGDDFRFGYRGAGNYDLLKSMGGECGFEVSAMDSICTIDGLRISSSAIRAAVDAHDLARARDLLGHELTLTGRVHHGAKRGRELTTPTANLHVPEQWCLPNGVYVVKIQALPDTTRIWGIANLGVAPTFDGRRRKLEVHAFMPLGNVYGQMLRIEMASFIRSERRFADRDTLQQQIQQDIVEARAFIAAETE